MRTLLAVVAAAAMIAAALYVRGGDDGGGITLGPSQPARLVCIAELADVCNAIAADGVEITIEEAGETAAALLEDDPGGDSADATEQAETAYDAWLTLAPWPQIASDARQRNGGRPLPAPGAAVARSPLVMVASAERAVVLDDECGGELSWRCVGRVAGKPWADLGGEVTWGQVKPGYPDPSVSATGLLVLGQAASDYLGGPGFSARDMEDDGFLAWLSNLERAVPTHGTSQNTPFQQRLQFGASRFDVVGTTQAEAAPQLDSDRGRGLLLRYPETATVADVVLAPLREGDGASRLQELVEGPGAAELAKAGWRVEGQPLVAGIPDQPALPKESNLPDPGVLAALQARWGEISR